MATINGLTAERMLEIEAASIVDGDVSGDNLFLYRKDGTPINAGSVRGPQGVDGPMGHPLAVVTAQPVLDVGIINQIRAGRQLSPADFTNLGLNTPLGLWNGSTVADSSGNGRNLTNKGSVPFGVGINGAAATAYSLAGSSSQGLYIVDTGAADPFRIRTGSIGIWFRSAKKATTQYLLSKLHAASGLLHSYYIAISGTSNLNFVVYSSSGSGGAASVTGLTDVCDDRWHFVVCTFDGSRGIIYLDGAVEASFNFADTIFGGPGPVNLGSQGVDASSAAQGAHYGRLSNGFITGDVLSEAQQRNLYCASIPHTVGAMPTQVTLSVRRKKRGALFATTDFPAQPVRLYSLVGGSGADSGSNNVPVTASAGPITVSAGPDGKGDNSAFTMIGSHQGLFSTDAGLPSGLNPRSYGAWFKTIGLSGGIISWGTMSTQHVALLYDTLNNGGVIQSRNGGDAVSGPLVSDGKWHFAAVVEDNNAADGVRRKLYLDGRMVGGSTVLNSIVLGGAGAFRIGAFANGTIPLVGSVARPFVYAGALTADQVRSLYNVSGQQLAPSVKAAADHIEALEATRVLATFDTIETADLIDLGVAA